MYYIYGCVDMYVYIYIHTNRRLPEPPLINRFAPRNSATRSLACSLRALFFGAVWGLECEVRGMDFRVSCPSVAV